MKSSFLAILAAAAVQAQTTATSGDVPTDCYALPADFQAACLKAQAGDAAETYSEVPLSDLITAAPTGTGSGDDMGGYGTSTILITNTITISSCHPTITNCPYTTAPVTTVTILTSTTYCPITATSTTASPSSSGSGNLSSSTSCNSDIEESSTTTTLPCSESSSISSSTSITCTESSGGTVISTTSSTSCATGGETTITASCTHERCHPTWAGNTTAGGVAITSSSMVSLPTYPQVAGAGKREVGMMGFAAGLAALVL